MRTSSGTRTAVVAGVLAAALGLAGCGDLTTTQGPVANSADAPHLSRAQFVPAIKKAMAASGSMHIESRSSQRGKKSTFVADASMTPGGSIGISVRDELGVYGKPSTRTFKLRLVADTMYIAAGKPGTFIRADASDHRTVCGCIARQLRQAASPEGSIATFRQGLVALEFLGLDAREGLYLQHYRADVDPKRILGAKKAQRLKLPKLFIYDVWLDSDNLPRRITSEVSGIEVDTTYSDWGKRIDIDPPGPKQIVNAPRAARA